jgi:hypothetical protein
MDARQGLISHHKDLGGGIVYTSTMLINPHDVAVLTDYVQGLAAPITRQVKFSPEEIRRREIANLGLDREDGVIEDTTTKLISTPQRSLARFPSL